MTSTKPLTKIMSREDYYAIHGLLVLAERHYDAMHTIDKALMELLGEEEEGGHASDAVWSPGYRTPDELLALYGWEVKKEKKP